MSSAQIHDLSNAVRDRLVELLNRVGGPLPDSATFEAWCSGIAALGDPALIRYAFDLLGNYAQNHPDVDAERAAVWARCWRVLDDSLRSETRSVTLPEASVSPAEQTGPSSGGG
jgi:hypothetical protein